MLLATHRFPVNAADAFVYTVLVASSKPNSRSTATVLNLEYCVSSSSLSEARKPFERMKSQQYSLQ